MVRFVFQEDVSAGWRMDWDNGKAECKETIWENKVVIQVGNAASLDQASGCGAGQKWMKRDFGDGEEKDGE